MLEPDWPAPARVRALVTTSELGDMAGERGRRALRSHLPAEPQWLRQVHGKEVIEVDQAGHRIGDASISRTPGNVCAVMVADCMPVFFADEQASVIAVAHAGWRGLAAGVLDATVDALRVSPSSLIAWLGPAIGPGVYEVSTEVLDAFPGQHAFFRQNRPGHWLLDLYGIARSKLAARGVRVSGGGFCTYSDSQRFFSYRRSRTAERMAAAIWLT